MAMVGERAATGTWNGPAPNGTPKFAPCQWSGKAAPEPEFDTGKEPREIPLLGNRGRLPLLGAPGGVAAAALAAGVKHIRCSAADDLKAVGAALVAVERGSVYVSVKLANDEHGSVKEALNAKLSALGVDYVDLLSLEWPVAWKKGTRDADPDETIEATWAQMEAAVDDGAAKAIGLANCSLPIVERIMKAARIKPSVNEVESHPLLAQRKLVGVCRRYGVTLMAHTPLAGGDARVTEHPAVAAAVASSGRSKEQVLLRWSVQRGVAVVADGAEAGAMGDVVAGAFGFRLSNVEKNALDAMEKGNSMTTGNELRTFVPDFAFEFDDPFLGGAGRPGLAINPN